jgi:D-3-phosphoglycerate dehydrogenase / 2-oxoglutarate reductase
VNALKRLRVLVTPTSFGRHDPEIKAFLESQVGHVVYNPAGRPLSSAELVPLLPGVDGMIAGLDCIDLAVIQAADRLKVIARYGVGVDAVDLKAAEARGIVVTNTPGANAGSVAELTVGLMLALARDILNAVQATKSGDWPRLNGLALQGKTIGLVGFGAIGREVARRLLCFNCTILAYDPLVSSLPVDLAEVQLLPIDEVTGRADFLSLHCPLTPETRGMVDAGFLERMKPGAFLVNTARGELLDEAALLAALQIARLRGVALDVFAAQPPPQDHPLLALPQVIATPHMGSHTDSAMNTMGWMAMRDCLAVLRGEAPLHQVA